MLYILENILKEHDMLVIYTVLFIYIYIYIISVLETILFFLARCSNFVIFWFLLIGNYLFYKFCFFVEMYMGICFEKKQDR